MKLLGFLALFFLTGLSLAATTSGTMEVDLVFPRANQTYPRVYPFPIVFGIQNPDLAQTYDLSYIFDVHAPSTQAQVGSETNHYPDPATQPGKPPISYAEFNSSSASYQIFHSEGVVNSTAKQWVVYYSVGHSRNCTAPSREGERPAYGDMYEPRFTGVVYFELSDDEGGELPSGDEWLAQGDGDGCGMTVFTSNVKEGLTNAFNIEERGVLETCPVLSSEDPQPDGDACKTKPGDQLKKSVVRAMLDVARCVDVEDWPSKDLRGACNDPKYNSGGDINSGGNIFAGNRISDIAFGVALGAAAILAL